MTEREYKRLLREAETKYQTDVASIERVWELCRSQSTPRTDHGDLRRAVAEAINRQSGQFSAQDIESDLRTTEPDLKASRASISRTLKRLEGDIVNVERAGKGRNPTIYRASSSHPNGRAMSVVADVL